MGVDSAWSLGKKHMTKVYRACKIVTHSMGFIDLYRIKWQHRPLQNKFREEILGLNLLSWTVHQGIWILPNQTVAEETGFEEHSLWLKLKISSLTCAFKVYSNNVPLVARLKYDTHELTRQRGASNTFFHHEPRITFSKNLTPFHQLQNFQKICFQIQFCLQIQSTSP